MKKKIISITPDLISKSYTVIVKKVKAIKRKAKNTTLSKHF